MASQEGITPEINRCHHLPQDRDKYQFGKTKIFFRAGQVAYLEKLRSDKLRACGVLIQKMVRGWLARTRYTKIRRTVLLVQTYGRGLMARRWENGNIIPKSMDCIAFGCNSMLEYISVKPIEIQSIQMFSILPSIITNHIHNYLVSASQVRFEKWQNFRKWQDCAQ